VSSTTNLRICKPGGGTGLDAQPANDGLLCCERAVQVGLLFTLLLLLGIP
jgi:hypothetical protein